MKLSDILNEIGEGVTPFPYRRTGVTKVDTWMSIMSEYKGDGSSVREEDLPAIEYVFKSDKATYKVKIFGNFSRHIFINFSGKPTPADQAHKYTLVIAIAFDDASNPDLGQPGKEKITNYGEQFKVLSTVTEISLEVAKEIMEIQWVKLNEIHVGPKLESGEEGKPVTQTKRGRLYLEYIKKQGARLPGNWTASIQEDRFVLHNAKISSTNPDKYIDL